MFKKSFHPEKLSTLIIYFSILYFIVAFNFSDNRSGGWQQQFLPNINPSSISDITFVDSLIGYAVTNYVGINDIDYILKTTNAGNNWNVVRTDSQTFAGFNKIVFLNNDSGYTCGVSDFPIFTSIQKTTNGGMTWQNVNTPDPFFSIDDISVLNNDTIWIAVSSNPTGGVFKTTNGGITWQRQINLGSRNPNNIYMYNKDIGFISECCGSTSYLRKTTDGGQSWFVVVNNEGFSDIYFADSLTGWRAYGTMKKTTNGGLNWVNQTLPKTYFSEISKFSNVNRDTIWGIGGIIAFPNNQARAIIYHTTNGGNDWGYQLPDTSIHKFQYFHCKFIDKSNGWAYATLTGVHTKSGGDTTFYTSIKKTGTLISGIFKLHQNYPNPFNPRTSIPFSLKSGAFVKLIAFDITGREIQRLADGRYEAGEYEVDFMGKFSASCVYFYRIEIIDNRNEKFTETKSMMLIK